MCEDGQDRQTKHVQEVQGNFVVDLSSFSFILEEMAVCRDCEVGKLELFDCGTKASCASLLMIRCRKCYISKSFWSVSGKFGKKVVPLRR